MTAKDLNFTFDRSLAQASDNQPGQPTGDIAAAVRPAQAEWSSPARRKRKLAGAVPMEREGGRQWIATACIALVNMLFLVLAGIWVSGLVYPATVPATIAATEPDPVLAELVARMGGLEQQLGELQISIARQQQAIVSAQLAIQQQLEQGWVQPESAAGEVSESESPPPLPAWHINLGDFPGRQAAVALQRSMRELGHKAQIRPRTEDGKTLYLVMLPGFSDRAAADQVARQIMEQTSLNGLWVGSGD